jgi:hypothetical protein
MENAEGGPGAAAFESGCVYSETTQARELGYNEAAIQNWSMGNTQFIYQNDRKKKSNLVLKFQTIARGQF